MWQSSNTIRAGQMLHKRSAAWRAVRRRMGFRGLPHARQNVFSVYRLGEDGDLLQGRWWYAFGLGVKSSLL